MPACPASGLRVRFAHPSTYTPHLVAQRSSFTTRTPPPIPPHVWLEVLENTARAPWLATEHTAHDKSTPEQRMKRAFSRIFQIFMYLCQPREDVPAYLVDFEKSPAEPNTEMTRSRNAIATLTRTVVRDMTSIPQNSELRSKHPVTFAIADALTPLYDMYLRDAEEAPVVPQWAEFWDRASPILVTLGEKLREDGYGSARTSEGGGG